MQALTVAGIHTPVLRDLGGSCPYVPASCLSDQPDLFRRAEIHVLEGLGHWPFLDDPEAVEGILLPFLRRATDIAP